MCSLMNSNRNIEAMKRDISAFLASGIYVHCKRKMVALGGVVDESGTTELLNMLNLSENIMLGVRADLTNLFKKAMSRKQNDGKVPPGSSLVRRTLLDDRFLLYLINILRAQLLVDENARPALRAASLWFPRGTEGALLRGDLLRQLATSKEDLLLAESLFKKSIEVGELFRSLCCDNAPSFVPPAATTITTGEAGAAFEEDKHSTELTASVLASAGATSAQIEELVPVLCTAGPGCLCVTAHSELLVKENAVAEESELCASHKARELLLLMLCQQGRMAEAYVYLDAANYSWRLSRSVFQYPITAAEIAAAHATAAATTVMKHAAIGDSLTQDSCCESSASATLTVAMDAAAAAELDRERRGIVQAMDNALPPEYIAHLQHVFRPDAPFWKEHAYDTSCNCSKKVGYFSYLYPLATPRQPKCSIDIIIDEIYEAAVEQFPSLVEATVGA